MTRRLPGVILLGALALVLSPPWGAHADPAGIAAPEAIGPWLEGRLPSVTPGEPAQRWALVNAFPHLTFTDPVFLTQEPGTDRLLVLELGGRIHAIARDPQTTTKTLVLDIHERVNDRDDSGATHFVFHPDYGVPGARGEHWLYLMYRYTPLPNTSLREAYVRLSRFSIDAVGGAIDPASEFVLIQQYDAHSWHNGGMMFFDPEGLLWFTIGDEGAANDSFDSAQKIDTALMGGVFRIDVDRDPSRSHPVRRLPRPNTTPPAGWPETFSQGYWIPDDNPWLDVDGELLEEFWALGIRSPHRMTRDAVTGTIYLGDIGQARREEVNRIVRGANYGWPFREGTIAGARPVPPEVLGQLTEPWFDYPDATGSCIIGGWVYRGQEHAALLAGRYLFADHSTQGVFTLSDQGPGQRPALERLTTGPLPGGKGGRGFTGWGLDADDEPYLMRLDGRKTGGGVIYRLARTDASDTAQPPSLLSETGAFVDLATLTPAPGLHPYSVNTPLWSDGATKRRWMAIPNDGTHDLPSEQIEFAERGSWGFPDGTVLVKHFELGSRRLETRFLVRGEEGAWYGITYRWRPDGSDAELLSTSLDEAIDVDGEVVQWHYPSRTACFDCHTAAAGFVLGPRTHQLNGDHFYVETNCLANQVESLRALGVLSPAPAPGASVTLLASPSIDDEAASLERRAHAYLASNCAHCHQPGGVQASMDLRLETPPLAKHTLGVVPADSIGVSGARLVAPGDPDRSVLYLRASSLEGCCAMPPLAKNAVDAQAMAVVRGWIESLDPALHDASGLSEAEREALRQAGDLEAPVLTLGDLPAVVDGPFAVEIAVSEPIVGFEPSDAFVTNGTITELQSTPGGFRLTVVPQAAGELSLSIPADRVHDLVGNANAATRVLRTTFDDTAEPPPAPEPTGPGGERVWLRLNDLGTEVVDAASGEGVGSLVGGVTPTDGPYGSALAFDGTDAFVSLDASRVEGIRDRLTVAFWVRPAELRGWDGLVTTGGVRSPWAVQLADSGALRFTANWNGPSGASGGGSWDASSPLRLDAWQHVAVVYDGARLRYYLDGVLDARQPAVELVFGQGEPRFVLGAGLPFADEHFRGALDDVRIYDRALSTLEIASLLEDGTPDTEAPTGVFRGPAAGVAAPFAVELEFSEGVLGLTAADFVLDNVALEQLTGGPRRYDVRLRPLAPGTLRVRLPAGAAHDAAGNANAALPAYTSTYTPAPPPPPSGGPVLHLALDEGQGSAASDSSATGATAVLREGATWTTGALGAAVTLDGRGAHVAITPEEIHGVRDVLTLTAWVRARQLEDWDALITKGGTASPWALQLRGDGALRFTAKWGGPSGASGAGTWESEGRLTVGTWHHVALTYDGSHLRFFLDGVVDPEVVPVLLTFGSESTRFVLGAGLPGAEGEFLDGDLDEVRLYDQALTAAEIAALHAAR